MNSGTIYCSKCGSANSMGAKFCSQCAASLRPTEGQKPDSVPVLAPAVSPVDPVLLARRKAEAQFNNGCMWVVMVLAIVSIGGCFILNQQAAEGTKQAALKQQHLLPIRDANLQAFRSEMPNAVAPYVAFVEPWLNEDPNQAKVRFEKSWSSLSVVEQEGAKNILAEKWFEIVKKNPAGDAPTELWIYAPDDSLIDGYSPNVEPTP